MIRQALLLALAFSTPAAAAPLLTNGSFEKESFAGWVQSGNTEYTSVFNQDYDGLSPQKGAWYALLGPAGADGVLSQSFLDTAGSALHISFWVASNGGTPNDFSAMYDGAALLRLSDTGVMAWTQYSAVVTATGDDTLSFSFRDDQDYRALDNVAVSQTVPVPEPAGYLLLPAAGSLLFLKKKKQKDF